MQRGAEPLSVSVCTDCGHEQPVHILGQLNTGNGVDVDALTWSRSPARPPARSLVVRLSAPASHHPTSLRLDIATVVEPVSARFPIYCLHAESFERVDSLYSPVPRPLARSLLASVSPRSQTLCTIPPSKHNTTITIAFDLEPQPNRHDLDARHDFHFRFHTQLELHTPFRTPIDVSTLSASTRLPAPFRKITRCDLFPHRTADQELSRTL